MTWTRTYKLDGTTPVPCEDAAEWSQWFENADRQVAEDVLPDGRRVSTVFLGIDHNFAGKDERPILFETMIFAPRSYCSLYTRRCATWAEAEYEHELALSIAKKTTRTTS